MSFVLLPKQTIYSLCSGIFYQTRQNNSYLTKIEQAMIPAQKPFVKAPHRHATYHRIQTFFRDERQKFVKLKIIHSKRGFQHYLALCCPVVHVLAIVDFLHDGRQFFSQRIPDIPHVTAVQPIVIYRYCILLNNQWIKLYVQSFEGVTDYCLEWKVNLPSSRLDGAIRMVQTQFGPPLGLFRNSYDWIYSHYWVPSKWHRRPNLHFRFSSNFPVPVETATNVFSQQYWPTSCTMWTHQREKES